MILRHPWLHQPSQARPVNWSNPVTTGLIRLYDFAHGGQDACGRRVQWSKGVLQIGPSPMGTGLRVNNYRVATSNESVSHLLYGNEITAIFVGYKHAQAASTNFMFAETDAASANYNWGFYEAASDTASFFVHNGTAAAFANPAGAWVVGVYPQVLMGRWVAGGRVQLWRNGVYAGQSGGTLAGPIRTGAYEVALSRWTTSAGDYTALLGGIWTRYLSDYEMASVGGNPWQLFAPAAQQIWVPSATNPALSAAAATNVAQTTADLQVTITFS